MVFACFHFYNITGSFNVIVGLINIIVVIKLFCSLSISIIFCAPVCLSAVHICITKLSIRSSSISIKEGSNEIGFN
jgi:hypothetical protein